MFGLLLIFSEKLLQADVSTNKHTKVPKRLDSSVKETKSSILKCYTLSGFGRMALYLTLSDSAVR